MKNGLRGVRPVWLTNRQIVVWIVVASGIFWFLTKDTFDGSDLWWDILVMPAGLFVLYWFCRIALGIFTRGHSERR